MIREYLVKLQALQLKAFDKGINMQIETRQDSADGYPWIVAYMYMEGCDFVKEPEEEHPCLYFSICSCWDDDQTREEFNEHIKTFEKFIETH